MYMFVYLRIHEKEQSVFCHDGYSIKNIHLREDRSSNNMIIQLTWFHNSSMRKYISDNEKKVGDGSQVLSIR